MTSSVSYKDKNFRITIASEPRKTANSKQTSLSSPIKTRTISPYEPSKPIDIPSAIRRYSDGYRVTSLKTEIQAQFLKKAAENQSYTTTPPSSRENSDAPVVKSSQYTSPILGWEALTLANKSESKSNNSQGLFSFSKSSSGKSLLSRTPDNSSREDQEVSDLEPSHGTSISSFTTYKNRGSQDITSSFSFEPLNEFHEESEDEQSASVADHSGITGRMSLLALDEETASLQSDQEDTLGRSLQAEGIKLYKEKDAE
ncbi:MAG: hypothetical protein JWO53_966 [Chlamydiia bacterium]|nr:hypothetical protein [Chlamydiia bacterium]